MKALTIFLPIAALFMGAASHAQDRVQAPQPPRAPGYEAPKPNPVMVELKALQAKVDALEQSAGRQIITLHFEAGQGPGFEENNSTLILGAALSLCQTTLKDRFGRVLSYRTHFANGYFYPSHVLCESKP